MTTDEDNNILTQTTPTTQGGLKTLAGGRYRILGLAGRGGMSLVYHAFDTENDRDVAIKILSTDLLNDENFLVRFQRESELMRDLDHPNILRAYDYGQEGERVYLVMSYYGGGTLRDRIMAPERLSLAEIAVYLTQVAAGLGYAHSRNVVHRDVKPSNILLHHASDRLVLSDFGIAKALSNSNPSRTGTIMGTPLYMAPEQFLDRVDKRSDIYSLGVVLYQMLTGHLPFQGEGIGFKHLNDPVPPLGSWGVQYASPIERVVQKALAKRPEARFQKVEDLAAAFQEAVDLSVSSPTVDAFLSVSEVLPTTTPLAIPAWKATEKLRLPAQAQLTEIAVITPSQLQTDWPTGGQSLREQDLPPLEPTIRLQIPAGSASVPPTTGAAQPASRPEPAQAEVSKSPGRSYTPLGQVSTPPGRPLHPIDPVHPRRKRRRLVGVLVLLLLLALAGGATALYLNTKAGNPAQSLPSKATVTSNPTATANITAATTGLAAPQPTVQATTPEPLTTSPAVTGPDVVLVFTSLSDKDDSTYLFSYDVRSPSTRQLTTSGRDSAPAWSRDGQKIVFQRRRGEQYDTYDLFVMGFNSGIAQLVSPNALNPEFAHKSNQLVYVSQKDNELYMISADDTSATPLRLTATGGRPKLGPSWAYDDRRIVFAMENETTRLYSLYILDLSRTKAAPASLNDLVKLPVPATATTENLLWPTFSPDGTKIVFSTNDNNPDIKNRYPKDIWVVNADGKGLQRIVGNQGRNSHPVWVPESGSKFGSRIYFNSDRGPSEAARIYSMNPDGSDQTLVLTRKEGNEVVKSDDYAVRVFVRS